MWVRCTSCAIPSLIIEHQTKTPFGTDPGGWNSEPNRQKGPPQQIQHIPHSELKNQGHTIFQTRYRGGSLPVNSTLSKHLPSKGPYIESKIKGAAIILTSVYTSVNPTLGCSVPVHIVSCAIDAFASEIGATPLTTSG